MDHVIDREWSGVSAESVESWSISFVIGAILDIL